RETDAMTDRLDTRFEEREPGLLTVLIERALTKRLASPQAAPGGFREVTGGDVELPAEHQHLGRGRRGGDGSDPRGGVGIPAFEGTGAPAWTIDADHLKAEPDGLAQERAEGRPECQGVRIPRLERGEETVCV